MSRYFVARRTRAFFVEDEHYASAQSHLPTVNDHEAVDTGLLDVTGEIIFRSPNPCGFGKDDEW